MIDRDNERYISIHAPRVGCDLYTDKVEQDVDMISIHAPRVGCDCGGCSLGI